MYALKQRILKDGRNLGNGILKVDSFVNHQVDPALMDACGRELAARFANVGATKILTAEISGIAPAVTTAMHLGVPVVYARKTKPITMPDQVFLTTAPSHTKGRMVELIVSPEYLAAGERVVIIDDVITTGGSTLTAIERAREAGLIIDRVVTLIDREEGGRENIVRQVARVEAVFTRSDIMSLYEEKRGK